MISDDEYLERIVAGIHSVSSDDADVRWNEKINGRQFDVVVRFRLGTLSYLVLIEVKNRSRPASASDAEAFVLKAQDQLANKAVFVSRAGFQEGAITVAKRHGLDLFKISFDSEKLGLSPATNFFFRKNPDYDGVPGSRLEISEAIPTQVIEQVCLIYEGGCRFTMPDESSQMEYYAYRTALADGRCLHDLLQSIPAYDLPKGKSRREDLKLPSPVFISPPDDYYFPDGSLASIEVKVAGDLARRLTGNIGIEPTAFSSPVLYTNVLTGEETEFTASQLPLNTEALESGAFYMQLYPLRYLHCARIQDHLATWDLIESFQLRELIRGTFIQDVKYSSFYIPVRDGKTVQRLKRRLADYRELQDESKRMTVASPVMSAGKRWKKPKALRGR